MPTPIMPNSNSPLGQGTGKDALISVNITAPWLRAFASLFASAILPDMLVVYVGTVAPTGWVHDVTAGLPSLPAGMIWIKRV